MTIVGAQGWFKFLVEQARILASSAEDQSRYLRDSDLPVDELRICFLDVGSWLFPLYREYQLIDELDEAAVLAVENHLNDRTGDRAYRRALYYDWSQAKDLPYWSETRRLANSALVILQRLPSERALG